jgi:C4-dicarboxylate-specific signal transduction histidine kinase
VQVADHLPKVCGDRIQIEQVMLNLMFNGIEAMEEAGSSPKDLWISCTLLEAGKVDVAIKDTGPGLDSKAAARIFEPFFTTKMHGMGLGLAISRTIIESHAGRLWVETNTSDGAEFHFTLPVAEET